MPDYPRLPIPPAPAADDTIESYGLKILLFVVRERVTATLSNRDLELADYVYPIAVSRRGSERLPAISEAIAERLAEAHSLITAAIAWRTAEQPAEPPVASMPAAIVSAPGGRLAPLQPAPIRRPPAGVAIEF